MAQYYSEHGEDFLLSHLFPGKTDGFFVEVGSIDGRRLSNTLFLEEQGWRGLCVEAHPDYTDIIRRNRPNSIVCACAAGETDEDDVPFYMTQRGSLSSLDCSREAEFRRRFSQHFSGYECIQMVQKRRLDTLFRTYGITQIDVLSLDIEGYEVEALRGCDLLRYRPTVLIIESEGRHHQRQLDKILLPHGYRRPLRLEQNIFYLCGPALERQIMGKVFDITLLHTAHPLDTSEGVQLHARIDTRRKTILRQSMQGKLRSLVNIMAQRISPDRTRSR